jgi:hypothetical protein
MALIARMSKKPFRSVCAGALAALVVAGGVATAHPAGHFQRDPYKCTGQQVWFYDWHPGSDGLGGFGFWDDDVKVCQGPWAFTRRWLQWTRNQLREK